MKNLLLAALLLFSISVFAQTGRVNVPNADKGGKVSIDTNMAAKLNVVDTSVFARKTSNQRLVQMYAPNQNTDTIKVVDRSIAYYLYYGGTGRAIVSLPLIKSGQLFSIYVKSQDRNLLSVEGDSLTKSNGTKVKITWKDGNIFQPRYYMNGNASLTAVGKLSLYPLYSGGYPNTFLGYDTSYTLNVVSETPGYGQTDTFNLMPRMLPPANGVDTSWVPHAGGYWGPDKVGSGSGGGTVSGRDIYRYNDTLTSDRTMNGNGKDLNLGAGTSNLDNVRSLNVYANRGWKFNDSLGGSFRSDTGRLVIQSSKGISIASLDTVKTMGKHVLMGMQDRYSRLSAYEIDLNGRAYYTNEAGGYLNYRYNFDTDPDPLSMMPKNYIDTKVQTVANANHDVTNMYYSGNVLTIQRSGLPDLSTVINAGGGSLTPAGSDGDVQYKSGSSLAATPDLHWDATNGRLGIGTATPQNRLAVAGGNINVSFNGGNGDTRIVGIGLDGSFGNGKTGIFRFGDENNQVQITTGEELKYKGFNGHSFYNYTGLIGRFGTGYTSTDSYFNGRLGIGTTTPSEKLEVSGNAKITGTVTGGVLSAGNTDGSIVMAGGTYPLLQVSSGGNAVTQWLNTPDGGMLFDYSSNRGGYLRFRPNLNSGSSLYINAAQNVAIGDYGEPTAKLDVGGDINVRGTTITNVTYWPNVPVPTAAPSSGCIDYANGNAKYTWCAGMASPIKVAGN